MDSTLLSIILHPIRIRIIQTLVKNKNMTVQQIAKDLPDVPQATLYRHLNKLVEAKAIVVVKENKIRGALEKIYAIAENPYTMATKDLNKEGREECLNLFYQFLMSLLGDFERYVNSEDPDLQRDGVVFRSAALYLNDSEYKEFLNDIVNVFSKVMNNEPSQDRRLRKISTIITPVIDD